MELDLTSVAPEVLDAVAGQLQSAGAPKGSCLVYGEGTERPLGNLEGLAVYLNGTDLPDETYRECDINFVYSEFNRLLEGQGAVHSHWQGPTETALYVYGTSYDAMHAALVGLSSPATRCVRRRASTQVA